MTAGVAERRLRLLRGYRSELWAAVALKLKGYRILARRYKTHAGEIDLVAVRGARLAFVEVKHRQTLADLEASISPKQRQRIRRAADLWRARHPRYLDHEVHFDLVFLVPWRWPCHLADAL